MTSEAESIGPRLGHLLEEAALTALSTEMLDQFNRFYDLFTRWNAKLNLSSVRDREGILRRHFIESIACAQGIPPGVRSLLDFGSGAGLPGIPVSVCRPEIAVTLSESQVKKAAFLNEAVRTLGLRAKVHYGRAETLKSEFDCVTLRAVDRMGAAVRSSAPLVRVGGWIVLMTTSADSEGLRLAGGRSFAWEKVNGFGSVDSSDRVILVGRKI